MDLQIGGFKACATDVTLEGLLEVAEVRAFATDASVRVGVDGAGIGGELGLSATVVEASVNRLLARVEERRLRGASVALLDGSVRVTGRYGVAGPLRVPFELTGTLEVEGGARLRLQADRVRVIGASLPGIALGTVAEHVNAVLADVLDVTRLPVPVRLTRVVVEPGRLTLHAVWPIDAHLARPSPAAIEPA